MPAYFRACVDAMDGYTPGEQPRIPDLIKLNTNENPYPPSPAVEAELRFITNSSLRLYPDPTADILRDAVAETFGLRRGNVIAGNGSDDILTIAVRSFVPEGGSLACADPSYSLYPVLAGLQGAAATLVGLDADFALPENCARLAGDASLFLLARPNAPTGNNLAMARVEELCAEFQKRGRAVLVDEAYADFSDDDCVGLLKRHPNLIVSRTMSKSYSLAGIRVGWAMASEELIAGMMKVKDSYNVNAISARLAAAALRDRAYFEACVARIKATRTRMEAGLGRLGFKLIPSSANFVFASPPSGDGAALLRFLRENRVLVRHFPGPRTGAFVRITVGTDEQLDVLLELCAKATATKYLAPGGLEVPVKPFIF